MTDVNQVRINELARELEVKAKAIIDLLPGYGVTEKKTHSSSIPADVAERLRHHRRLVWRQQRRNRARPQFQLCPWQSRVLQQHRRRLQQCPRRRLLRLHPQ